MNKPYIVCYMMTSVDGRIDCDMVAQLPGVEDYYPLLDELNLQSAISGKSNIWETEDRYREDIKRIM